MQLNTRCGILQHKKKHKIFFNTKFLNTKIVVLKKKFQHEIVVLNKKFSVEKNFCVGHIIIVM